MMDPKQLLAILRREYKAVEILKKSLRDAEPSTAASYRKQISAHENKIAELYADIELIDDTENLIFIEAANRILN